MQAIESQKLILYQTDLRGQWPEADARSLTRQLRYPKRLALGGGGDAARESLAGIALALRALAGVLGRRVEPGELVFDRGEKPHLHGPCAADFAVDFSISHSAPWVACAAIAGARVGLDIEVGTEARLAHWVVQEALLKAAGAGLRAADEVRAIPMPQSTAPNACVRWRGESWYLKRLEFFPGTCACLLTSRAVRDLAAHSIPLADLFAI